MSEEQNGHGTSRLDRIERIMEFLAEDHLKFREEHVKFREEHNHLLAAQILLTDRMDRLAEAQKHTDESLNTLILTVDDLFRRRPEK